MSLEKRLTDERKDHIDRIVDSIRWPYATPDGIDYNAVCHVFHIRYFEDKELVLPLKMARFKHDPEGSILYDNEGKWQIDGWDIFNYPFRNEVLKEYSLGHELGHAVLDHRRDSPNPEREAGYFAQKLTGIKTPQWLIGFAAGLELAASLRIRPVHLAPSNSVIFSRYVNKLQKYAATHEPVMPR